MTATSVNEKMVDKIKKLLALSKSTDEGEAGAAAAKAMALAARYQIDMTALELEQGNPPPKARV